VDYYFYVFNPEIPGWDKPGSFHSVDLWFWFETLAKCWRPFKGKQYDLARKMCNYWVNFMKNGNPNGPDADGQPMPQWASYSKASPYGMYFGDDCQMTTEGPSDLVRFMIKQQLDNSPIG
jgi:para-nitrobenzyl esterase